MITLYLARFLARLGAKCDRTADRLYRIQSGIDARRAMARLTENHATRRRMPFTRVDLTYTHEAHDERNR